MRKNLSQVVDAFKAGRRAASGHASTDGVTIYSYMFPIARRTNDGNVRILTAYPSRTTQTAINALKAEFPEAAHVAKL